MVRKRRTELPGSGNSSGTQETAGGQGRGQYPPQQQPQGGYQGGQGRGQRPPQQQQGGGYQGGGLGRGQHPPQQQQQEGGYQGGGQGRGQRPPQQLQQEGGYQGGGRGWRPQHGGYGGRGGGGAPRGGMAPQQPYGGRPEYYQQGRGSQQHQQQAGAPFQQHSGFGGLGAPSGGPSRPPFPELHQATTQTQQQAVMTTQPVPYGKPTDASMEAGSSSQPPEMSALQVTQQFQQLAVQPEAAATQAALPASSKSLRFPLRPGKGNYGDRCIVKANHFFAELPDKDLHQYDVSSQMQ